MPSRLRRPDVRKTSTFSCDLVCAVCRSGLGLAEEVLRDGQKGGVPTPTAPGFEGLRVVPEALQAEDLAPHHKTSVISRFASGPEPAPRQITLTATLSAAATKSLIHSHVSASKVSRSCSNWRMTASRPTKGPGSGQPSGGRAMASGWYSSRRASMSSAFHASKEAFTISTFCCDIAYSDSPAASRAESRSRYSRHRRILPSRISKT